MKRTIAPPSWADYNQQMLINMSDLKGYYETYTAPIEQIALNNEAVNLQQDIRLDAVELDLSNLAQFPKHFDIKHVFSGAQRQNRSGFFTVKIADLGLGTDFPTHTEGSVLVVVNTPEEYQTLFTANGTASRVFKSGELTANWILGARPISSIADLDDVKLVKPADQDKFLYYDASGEVVGADLKAGQYPININSIATTATIIPTTQTNPVGYGTTKVSPYIIVNATTASREIRLPRISSENTNPLPNNNVRAGRITYVVNTTNVSHNMTLTGMSWYDKGNMTTEVRILPPRTTLVFTPSIINNGSGVMTECWIYTGMVFLDSPVSNLEQRLANGLQDVSASSIGSVMIRGSGDFTAANSANSPNSIGNGSSANKKFILPDIVLKSSDPGTGQVREGRISYLVNAGTLARTVELSSGCKICMDGTTVEAVNKTIPAGSCYIMAPQFSGADKVWFLMGHYYLGDVKAELLAAIKVVSDSAKTKFKDLTDTPGDYPPGQALVANMAGDALVYVKYVDTFLKLSDTPATYTGNKGKTIRINTAETAMEYVDFPETDLSDIEDRLDDLEGRPLIEKINDLSDVSLTLNGATLLTNSHLYVGTGGLVNSAQINPLFDGRSPVRFGSVGSQPQIITAAANRTQWSSSPYIICKAATTLNHPTVAIGAYDTYNAPATGTVREGKASYFVNASQVPQNLTILSGQMFMIEGNMTTTVQVVPAKSVTVILPARQVDNGSGAKFDCWIVLGNYPMKALDMSSILADIKKLQDDLKVLIDADLITKVNKLIVDLGNLDTRVTTNEGDIVDINIRLDALANDKVRGRTFLSDVASTTGSVTLDSFQDYDIVTVNGTTTTTCNLPKIVARDVAVIGPDDIRCGRRIVIINNSTGDATLRSNWTTTTENQKFLVAGKGSETSTIKLPYGYSAEVVGESNAGLYKWRVVRAGTVNVEEILVKAKNSLHAPLIKSTGSFSSSNLANNSPLIWLKATANTTITMPGIIISTAPASNTKSRVGRVLEIYNYSTFATRMVLNGTSTDNAILMADGTWKTTFTLNGGECAQFLGCYEGTSEATATKVGWLLVKTWNNI